jgi:large subunit ribosomal protein L15
MKTDHITGGSQDTHPTKRLGRGRGNGRGKTCCRGHKGSGQRSGYSRKPGFEGGQMPLYRKLPQRGFNNYEFRTEYSIVNVGDLVRVEGADVIDKEALVKAGLVRSNAKLIKILGTGELTGAVKIKADKFSKSATDKITAAGGEIVAE